MAVLIILALITLYCIVCVYEALFGSADNEPKWNIFHKFNN